MKRLLLVAAYATLFCLPVLAQSADDFASRVVRIVGAASIEDLNEDVLNHFERLSAHPIDINHAGRRKLLSCGLFSFYQACAIVEYITHDGDILSLAEFSAIDGIGEEYAKALAPFVRFEGGMQPDKGKKFTGEGRMRYRLKSGISSQSFKGAFAFGKYAGAVSEKNGKIACANLAMEGDGLLKRLIVGDFNAKFGQGLLSWTGFSMSTLYTVGAFGRTPSGLAPSNSLNAASAKRGIAVEFGKANLSSSLFATVSGEQLFSVGYLGRWGSVSLQACHGEKMSYSVDWRGTVRKLTLFGELASIDGKSALCSGAWYNRAYLAKAGVLLRLSSNEAALALGYENRNFSLTSEAIHKEEKAQDRIKIVSMWHPSYNWKRILFEPTLRINGRFYAGKTPNRFDCRLTFKLTKGKYQANWRSDVVRCEATGFLSYLEAGYMKEKTTVSARLGLFDAPAWKQRVYVCERDVPGSFNVVAYYGKGYFFSLYGRWKCIAARFGVRVFQGYSQPSRYELSVQADLQEVSQILKGRKKSE